MKIPYMEESMKAFKRLAVLFLILLILVSGCSKKSNVETSEIPKISEEQIVNSESEKDKESEENKINTDELNREDKENETESIEEKIVLAENEEINLINSSESLEKPTNEENNKTDNIENSELDTIINSKVQEEKDNIGFTEENTDEKQTKGAFFSIEGKVKNELQLTISDLKSMDDIFFEADFFSLNSFGTKAYFHFKGVKLWNLLEQKAEIADDATSVTIVAEDGYKMVFTIEQVKKQDYIDEQNKDMLYPIIIAWEENNVEYDESEGAPFKLVVGQKEAGDVNKPQWVSNINKIIIE
jgi:hypothetical protein